MTVSGNFERFQYFNFDTDFLVNVNLLKKLEYCFLVESTKIEYASFLYKTISEANVNHLSANFTKWSNTFKFVDHFVGLALKGLRQIEWGVQY